MSTPEQENIAHHAQRSAPRRLHTVRQFRQAHPAFTPESIRWLLFHRQTSGLECAVVHIGRRLLLDEDRFFAWGDEQNIPQEKRP